MSGCNQGWGGHLITTGGRELISKSKPSHVDDETDDGKNLGLVDIIELLN